MNTCQYVQVNSVVGAVVGYQEETTSLEWQPLISRNLDPALGCNCKSRIESSERQMLSAICILIKEKKKECLLIFIVTSKRARLHEFLQRQSIASEHLPTVGAGCGL